MLRHFVATCFAASIAVVLVQCGGKAEVVVPKIFGSGAGGAGTDASAGGGGAFIGSSTGGDSGGCDPTRGPCDGGANKYVPSCGDGFLNPGETCDDGNDVSGDGCTANCLQVEANFECVKPGKPCTSTVVCGDKKVTGNEQCDDGNATNGDGCSASCQVENGWACPIIGIRCEAAKCGDGIVAGSEECDDGHDADAGGGGCDPECHLRDGFVCNTPGKPCTPIVCGDGKREGNERCDDGNHDLGDGCTPFCQLEPDCDNGACTSPCGDGIQFSNEGCDDGNTKNGDGCSSTCTVEPGYTCTPVTEAEPDSIGIPLVIRDFGPTHPDFNLDVDPADSKHKESGGDDHDIVAPTLGTASTVADLVDGGPYSVNHKPVYKDQSCVLPYPTPANNWKRCTATTYDAASFQDWYRDVPGINKTVLQTLTLNRIGNNEYQFDSAANGSDGFFPIDSLGDGTQHSCLKPGQKVGDVHNFNFTSEVRYWFEYTAANPPTLQFSGDDDVFVYVNHQEIMDLGGIHGAEQACFTLSPAPGGGVGVACDAPDAGLGKPRIYDSQRVHPVTGLEDGKIYEIAVFQAERNECASNYKLTLTNFLASKSVCKSKCGDGIVTPDEVCDDGPTGNTGAYGKCGPDCKSRGAYCGDGHVQADQGEVCDDGVNLSPYGGCGPGCVPGPFCGDGIVQSAHEQCDDGKNIGAYNGCAAGCVLGPRCGDGVLQSPPEQCDDGNHRAGDLCGPTCQNESIN